MQKRICALISLGVVLTAVVGVQAEEPSGVLPLGKSWVGDQELPRPYGLGVNLYQQTQDYSLKSLRLNLPYIDMAQAAGVGIENRTSEQDLKLDVWVLPFLNVFGIVGNVDGETTVYPGPPLDKLEVNYDGLVYGGGVTLAGGYDRFFVSVSGILTETDLDTATSSVSAWIVTPRLGVRFDDVALWIGGMYQNAEEKHQGRISVPIFGDVAYDVELEEDEPWNYVAGASVEIAEHWGLELEAGFGNRKHGLVSISYRF